MEVGVDATGTAPQAVQKNHAKTSADDNETVLAKLRNSPAVLQLRSLTYENPSLVPALLAQLEQENPELSAAIASNAKELLECDAAVENTRAQNGLTVEESASVERLEAMGFSRPVVLQTYLACSKDEVLAANRLVERSSES